MPARGGSGSCCQAIGRKDSNMKRVAALAAILAASILPLGTASADGYRMHRHPAVWTGHFRHHAAHHRGWRSRADIVGVRAGYYGAGYYGADYDAGYDYPPDSPYGYSGYGYPPVSPYSYSAYAAYSGCGGCAPAYPSCYSYAYGCRPASPCGYYGGGCGGLFGYSRCGGC